MEQAKRDIHRLGDRVRVSFVALKSGFVALKSGHVCNRFTFPQLPFARLQECS
jgi:hypothetical protein